MAMDNIFGIAGTALNAQLTRMNATASNLANAGTVATTEQDAFRAKRPVFKALVDAQMTHNGAPYVGGVKVDRMADDAAHPAACPTRATPWPMKTVTSTNPM